jgi:hypothetical protein
LRVGPFDAQKRLPKGSGTPSFASSWFTRAAAYVYSGEYITKLWSRLYEAHHSKDILQVSSAGSSS